VWSVDPDTGVLSGKVGGDLIVEVTLGALSGDTQDYTVTLHGPVDHGGQGSGTDGALGFTVPVTVSDGHGGSDSGTLNVTIQDGTPSVSVSDLSAVGSGATSAEGSLSLSYGADDEGGVKNLTVQVNGGTPGSRPASGDWVIAGAHGTLTIHADDTYTYKADPNQTSTATDTFKFTITDADGDHDDATLSVTVNPAVGPNPAGVTVSVDEHGLTTPANPGDGERAPITLPDGFTYVGVAAGGDGNYGTVSVVGGSLVYTLTNPYGASGHDRGSEADTKSNADMVT